MELALLNTTGFALFGYLCGSLPFAIWITRWIKGVDVRAAGSHHATATNTMRQAGWAAGISVMVLDIAKGFLPTYLALHYGVTPWVAPIAAGMTVFGHCWPIFARFKGGMGLATAAGTFLAVSPIGLLIGVSVLIIFVLVIHHSARASVIAAPVIPIVLYLLGQRGPILAVSIASGLVIAIRFLRDWRRKYQELWLDREKKAGE